MVVWIWARTLADGSTARRRGERAYRGRIAERAERRGGRDPDGRVRVGERGLERLARAGGTDACEVEGGREADAEVPRLGEIAERAGRILRERDAPEARGPEDRRRERPEERASRPSPS